MSNFQKLYFEGPYEFNSETNQLTVTLKYQSNATATTGIGFGIRYDSTSMTLVDVSAPIAPSPLISLTTTANDDSDPESVLHLASYTVFGPASWPGNTDADLYTLTFEPVANGNDNYDVELEITGTAAGYDGITESHSAPVPLLVNEQSIDENSNAGQVVATVEGGPANATYSLVDNTVYGGSSSEAAELVIPELQAATQHVYVADRVFSADGSQVTLTVAYNADANATGLGMEVLFDSSALTLSAVSDVLQTNLFIEPAVENVLADSSDKDGDSSTDVSLNMSWASFVGSTWPGTAPANLLTMTFDVAEGFDDSSVINFVKTSGMAGYSFDGVPVTIEKPAVAPLSIDATTGDVTLNEVPDYEAISEYNFDVVATAGDASETVSATVSVSNVDEVAPSITSSSTADAVDENTAVVIYTATADDSADISDGIKFSLGSGSDSDLSIDEDTGEVTLDFSRDYETESDGEISFSVIATDLAGNASSEQSVTINLANLDEVAPTITSGPITPMIDENSGAGQVIYTATADDSMDISNGVTFGLSDNANGKVSIDSVSGDVTFIGNPDYENDSMVSFSVFATDAAGNQSISTPVSLDLNNLDDSAPIHMYGDEISLTDGFGGIEETHSNDEQYYMSQVVYTAQAYDDSSDVESGISYFSISDDHGGIFSIDSMTGEVSLDVAPDFEDESLALNDDMGDKYFSFTVTAVDANGNSADQLVKLYVKDVAELPPVFSSASEISIDENNDGSDIIYTASAVAHPLVVADGASDSVVYSLDANDNIMDFSIDSSSGEVTFISAADHEMQSSYSFTVVATDDLGNVNQLSVALTVNDLDEVAPTIDSGDTAVAIDENDEAQVIYTATADDSADISNGVTFSLGNGSDTALSINSETGEVSIDKSADYETQSVYSFSVIATDAANNVSSEQSVSLDINNLDDTAATITSADKADAIDENTGAAQVIYTATADDSADVSDGVSFSLAAGSDAALSIDAESGAVTLSADPDADTQSVYNFTVVATDAAGNASEKAVSLDITNLDEVAPTITSADTADAIDENSGAGQVIYTATADDSADVTDGVTFSLADGSDAALTIDADSGAVSISVDPDAEDQGQYSFTVIATDAAGNASEQAVTMNINDIDDTAPEITSPNTASVLESASENVAVYQAIVDDSADVSDGAISFSLEGDDAASFTVDSFGLVTLLDDPDTSLQPTYSFDVVATDSAGNASQQTVVLTVVDQDLAGPTFTSAISVAVDENIGADQHVYTATAADESSFVFSLAEGSDSALSIDADTGAVTLSTDPDADVQAQYNFTVIATDEAENVSSQSVTLTINDLDEIAPTITSESSAAAIDENTGAGQVIYTATSNDSHDVVQQGAISQKFIDNGDDTFTVQFFVDNSVAADFDQGIEGIKFTIGYMSDGSELSLEGVEHTSNALFALHNPVNNEIKFTAVYAEGEIYASADKTYYYASDVTPILEATFNASDVSQTNFITVSDIGLKHSASNTTSYFNGQAESSYALVDSDNGVTYSLVNGSDAALSIDSVTGAVTLNADPDADTQSQYSFTIEATDAAGYVSRSETISLDINNLDEVAATITSGDVAVAIDENSGSGQVIYTATADDSADVSGGVSFSLAEDSDAALSIDAETGAVTLNADPDADTQAQYSFTVVATDAAGNVSDQSVTLDINDLDDTAATVTSGATAAAIDENSGAGQVVYTATADDSADESDGVTFSLAAGSDAALSIDATTGEVSLNTDPDAEAQSQYSFAVVATDAAGNESAAQSVTLDINDLDDTAATITSGATAAAIDENSGAGQVVYTATADDSADVSDGVSFSLAAGSDPMLSIDAATGAVTLNADPDADTQAQYSFAVVATDAAGNQSAAQSVTLDINNLDEAAPTITSGNNIASIDENSGAGQVVYKATADDSLDVSGGVTFSLAEGSDSALAINEATGEVTLVPNPYAEKQDSYSFTVVATDAAGHSDEQSLQFSINDLHEVSVTYYSNNVEVNSYDLNDGVMSKSNQDVDANAVDFADVIAALRMSVGLPAVAAESGDNSETYEAAANVVNIGASEGKVTTADAMALLHHSVGLDYHDAMGNKIDFAPEWNFNKVSSDENSTNYEAYILGDVDGSWTPSNEDNPVIILPETAEANDVVFNFDTATQQVEGASRNLDVNEATGQITLKVDADFEGDWSGNTNFTVVSGSGNDKQTQNFVVEFANQDDTAPVFDSSSEVSVVESEESGQVVYVAVADDSADVSGGVTYSLGENDDPNLSIDAETGAVTLSSALIANASYSFTVTATDAAGNATDQSVTLNVDEIPDTVAPVIDSGSVADAIDENSGSEQVIYTASSVDDSPVTFSLTADSDSALSIDASSGAVTLNADPDADKQSQYSFAVVATDSAGNESEAHSVTLDINNLDEVAPTFTSGDSASNIDENSGAGTVIYTATADDSLDVSEGLSFELATNSDPALSINSETGEVTLASNADFETQSTYSFTVLLSDYVNATVTQSVTLDINNLDEVSATITSSDTAAAIDENSGSGQVIYTATADDSADVSGGVTFSLAAGSDAALSIDATTGAVTLSADPDAEAQDEYSFTVVATDAAGNVSDQSVTLDINDLDDTAATITSGDTADAIDENSDAGQVIYTATADDSADVSSGVTFSLAAGSDAALSIDAQTGAVTLNAVPDADTQAQYSFAVVATDAAGNESAAQSVTLDINDLDDAAPINTSSDSADAIDENSGAGQVIYTATAYDNADVSDGVIFSLMPGSDAALSIDAATGEVTLNADPDAEAQTEYSFAVKATDVAGNESEVQSVTLNVNNLDDTAATITSGGEAASINENSGSEQVIYTATADDSADVSDGVTFSLTSVSDSSLSIDSATGEVTLLTNPDAELVTEYSFTVVATDAAGNESAPQSVTLDISNLDEVAPTVTSGDAADAIDENSGAGQVIYTASADDSGDVSDGVTFSLAAGSDAALSIDATTGEVSLSTDPDADTKAEYSFTVVATDAAGNQSAGQSVTFDVTDLDDTAATITSGDTADAIDENSGTGQVIYTATADDSADVSDGVTFSLADGSDTALSIDAVTGAVTLNADPDADNQAQYSFTVVATDVAGNVSDQSVTLDINDLDDASATITSGDTADAIDENSGAGQVIYTVTADDSADDVEDEPMTFSLEAGSDAALSIDSATGAVTLNADPDADTQAQYSFTVVATDAAGNASAAQTVTLDITDLDDTAATITSGDTAPAIDENSGSGQVVYTATANDSADVSDGVTFSLAAGSDAALSIDAVTGAVTLNADPDAEAQSQYSFAVVATDAAGNESAAQSVTLDINNVDDSAPTITSGDIAASVDENIDAGQVVYTATADDSADVSDGVTFSLSEASDSALSIDAVTGAVTLSVSPDAETQDQYNFRVIATDAAGNSTSELVSLQINDLDEVSATITSGDAAAAIDENSGAGQVVYTATADDSADVSDGVTFSLADGSDAALSIDAATGAVTLSADPDADNQSQYNFTVVATDEAGNVSDQLVTLDINDLDDTAATVTSGATATAIDENSGAGQVVYTATADDSADVSDGVTFSLAAGSDAALSIDAATGAVTLNADPDADTQAQYSFAVVATDAAGNESSAQSVTLDINNLDDTAATITSGDTADAIDENSGAGQVIFTATADDSTDVSDGVTFSLAAGSDSALTIDGSNGEVTLSADPDAETQAQYSFTVVATDAAGNESSAQSVTLDINDIDDAAPTITSTDSVIVVEGTGSGQVVYQASSDDSGDDVESGIAYSLLGNNSNLQGDVSLTSNASGELAANTQVVSVSDVAKAGNQVSVTVGYNADNSELSGLGLRVHFDSSELTVASLSDVLGQDLTFTDSDVSDDVDNLDGNDNTDSFIQVAWASVDGNWTGEVPTDLLTINFDIASGASGSAAIDFSDIDTAVDYGFVANDAVVNFAVGDFSIDSDTGAVTLNVDPDHDVASSYNFTVVATDGEGQSDQQQVELLVAEEVANTTSSQVLGAVNQKFVQNADGSITMQLFVTDETAANYQNGIENIDLVLSYNTGEIGELSASQISSPSRPTMSFNNHVDEGELAVAQIYFPVSESLQASEPFLEVNFNLQSDVSSASFNVSGVIVGTEDVPSSSYNLTVETYVGTEGEDVYALVDGVADVNSGTGSDTFIVSENTGENILVDFESGVDTLELGLLLDSAGYTGLSSSADAADQLAHQVSGDTLDIADLISDADGSLDNAFGGYLDDTTNVLTVFADMASSAGEVDMQTLEVTLDEGSTIDDDDLAVTLSAFIA